MKALLHYRAGDAFKATIEALRPEWLDVVVIPEDDRAMLEAEIGDAEVMLHVLKPLTRNIIDQAHKLRLVQKIGVGVNTIDLEATRARGIAVCNMPGTNTQAVAELTLMLMLAVLRRVVALDGETRAGRGWALDLQISDGLFELAGRTVGLVGYGAVPQRLSPVLNALGARVQCYARRPIDDANVTQLPLDELFASSDIVSLHLPLTEATYRLVDGARLASIKKGAILINTARGGLVDEEALALALTSGALAGAGLDVFEKEPVDITNPLMNLKNVVVTPHLAWLTGETLSRSMGVAIDNCRRLREGEDLVFRV